MEKFSDEVLKFIEQLSIPFKLPGGIDILNPFADAKIVELNREFYQKYYSDSKSRRAIIGINPGRFGAGITGIPFTDPQKAGDVLKLKNVPTGKNELSSDFIYDVIGNYGGPKLFFSKFYITAVCPLGFVKGGVNLNYYDDSKLQKILEPFMVEQMKRQLSMNIDRKIAICLGEGKNFKYLDILNRKHSFFEKIISLPHPRFVMQYKRKFKDVYIKQYLIALQGTF